MDRVKKTYAAAAKAAGGEPFIKEFDYGFHQHSEEEEQYRRKVALNQSLNLRRKNVDEVANPTQGANLLEKRRKTKRLSMSVTSFSLFCSNTWARFLRLEIDVMATAMNPQKRQTTAMIAVMTTILTIWKIKLTLKLAHSRSAGSGAGAT